MDLVRDIFEKREQEAEEEKKKYLNLFESASKEIDLADHLLCITYPAVKDLKMLVAVEEHIIKAVFESLHALLEFLRQNKKIEAFSTNKHAMVDVFQRKVIGEKESVFNLTDKHFLSRLIDLDLHMRKSTFQFKRGDSYILALEDKSIKALNDTIVKNHTNFAKDFLKRVEKKLNSEKDNLQIR